MGRNRKRNMRKVSKNASAAPATDGQRSAPKLVLGKLAQRVAIFTILGAVTAASGYVYLRSTEPITLSAVLVASGDATLSYGTRQQDTYSPACGCMADKSERWRGITFAARHLQLRNVTTVPQTAYWLMGTFPEPLYWYPGLFRQRIRLLRLEVPIGLPMDTDAVLSEKWSHGEEVIEATDLPEDDVIALVTSEAVEVTLAGDKPLAAYIPVENSTISLTQRPSTFPTEPPRTVIRESYEDSQDSFETRNRRVFGGDSMAYPMIDLLGPTVLLISEDPVAELISVDSSQFLNNGAREGRRRVTALTLKPPFSSRISSMPFDRRVYDEENSRIPIKPALFQFKEPDRPWRQLRPGEKEVYFNGGPVALPTPPIPRKQGVTELTIETLLTEAEYSRIIEALHNNDKTHSHDIRSRAKELDHLGMEFRYPPMPPMNGFNVFGLLGHLKLSVSSGRLMIGATTISIDAPSVLDFRNIRALTTRGNVIPIPLVSAVATQALGFSLEATSELYINDKAVTIQADRYRAAIENLVIVSSILSGLSGLATLWHVLSQLISRKPVNR